MAITVWQFQRKVSGRDQGKGQGGKQSTNGKGQQVISGWTCGGNHKQQHRMKEQHVRQVADEGSKNQDDSSVGPQSSQQSHSNAASSSQAPASVTNQTTATSAPTSYRLNPVACAHGNSDEFEFDSGALGDFGNCRFVLFIASSLCDVSCEQFFIGSDDDSFVECAQSLQDISQLYNLDWASVDVNCSDQSIYECEPWSNQCLRDDRPWRPSRNISVSSKYAAISGRKYVIASSVCHPLVSFGRLFKNA